MLFFEFYLFLLVFFGFGGFLPPIPGVNVKVPSQGKKYKSIRFLMFFFKFSFDV